MNDPVAAGDFGRLIQLGGVGAIAAGLLALVVALVKQFASHALNQNTELIKQQREDQAKTLEALHAIGQRLGALDHQIATLRLEMTRDMGEIYNAVSPHDVTHGGSRSHRIKPPK